MTNTWRIIDEDAKEFERVIGEIPTLTGEHCFTMMRWDWRMKVWHCNGLSSVGSAMGYDPRRYMVLEGYSFPNIGLAIHRTLKAYEKNGNRPLEYTEGSKWVLARVADWVMMGWLHDDVLVVEKEDFPWTLTLDFRREIINLERIVFERFTVLKEPPISRPVKQKKTPE